MNATKRKLKPRFGPETRFQLKPVVNEKFESLKSRLLEERLRELWQPCLTSTVRRAANEASALVWLTPYPALLFPVLFEEKAETALAVADRQEQVRRHTRELLAV
jgi:hypothetical protein